MKLNIKNKQKKIIKIYKYVAIEQQQQTTCTQESIQSNTHNKLLTVFVNFKKLHTYIHTHLHTRAYYGVKQSTKFKYNMRWIIYI